MVNNFERLIRFHMITRFDNVNYKISIPNVNRESITTDFEFQVKNSRQ